MLGGEDEVKKVFLRFNKKPIGSGCCAQVYKATIDESSLSHGEGKASDRPLAVAVKVLHPDIRQQFERDLGVLRTLTAVLSTVFPSLRYNVIYNFKSVPK